jgi:hypothetical protein
VIERCIGWLKESRAVATRYDKLAVNFLATVHVAMIERYLRLLCLPDVVKAVHQKATVGVSA